MHPRWLVGASPSSEGTLKMAAKLALRGGYISPSEVHSPARPYCNEPVLIGRRTHPREIVRTMEVSMWAPCRKCPKCLQFRRLQWRDRMEREYDRTVGRTWFLTLTFDPIRLAVIHAKAHIRSSSPGYARAVDDVAYEHMQLYFKRLRKQGLRFRYFAVFELGSETGRPHYHALLHEGGPNPVTYRALRDTWPSPIFHAKLLEKAGSQITVRYLSKYLGKSLSTRPRCSLHYGNVKKQMTPFSKKNTY